MIVPMFRPRRGLRGLRADDAGKLNVLADRVRDITPLLGSGIAYPDGRTIDVPDDAIPGQVETVWMEVVEPPEDSRAYGEDYTNNRYWLKPVLIASDGNEDSSIETETEDPPQIEIAGAMVDAWPSPQTGTNIAEKVDGSHLLLRGTQVRAWRELDRQNPPRFHWVFDKPPRLDWIFRLGAAAAGDAVYTGTLRGRRASTADVNPAVDATLDDVGSTSAGDGAISCIALNLPEIGAAAALGTTSPWLSTTSRHPLDFKATLIHVNSDGTPVVTIEAYQNRIC